MKTKFFIPLVLFFSLAIVSCDKDEDETVCESNNTESSCQDCCDSNGFSGYEYNGLASSDDRCTCKD